MHFINEKNNSRNKNKIIKVIQYSKKHINSLPKITKLKKTYPFKEDHHKLHKFPYYVTHVIRLYPS